MTPVLLAVTGLQRETRLIRADGVRVLVGGGDGPGLGRRMTLELGQGPVRAVVSVGLGGALASELAVGDWVVGERIVSSGPSWAANVRLVRQLQAALRPLTLPTPQGGAGPFPLPQGERERGGASSPLPLRERVGPAAKPWEVEESRHGRVFTGAIAASDTMVVDAAGKAALHAATGALAVDMESHVAAGFAAEHGLPFAALRVISDGADRALPKAAQAGMKPDGGMDVLAVLIELARDPRQLPALIRTGQEAEVAFRQLALLGRHDLLGRLGVGDLDLGQLPLDVV